MDLGAGTDAIDLGKGNVVVDPLALVLEVEAGILQSYGKLDDGLPDFVNLLLGRNLGHRFSVFRDSWAPSFPLLTVSSSFSEV